MLQSRLYLLLQFSSLFKFHGLNEPVNLHLLIRIIFNHKAASRYSHAARLGLELDQGISIENDAAVIFNYNTVAAQKRYQHFPQNHILWKLQVLRRTKLHLFKHIVSAFQPMILYYMQKRRPIMQVNHQNTRITAEAGHPVQPVLP